MFKLSIENVQPGMRLGKNIYNSKGTLLLRDGLDLTLPLIHQLKQLKIFSIYISSDFSNIDIIEPPPIIRERTRTAALRTIRNTFHKCRLSNLPNINIRELKNTVKSIIENVLTNKATMIQAAEIRTHDDYTFAHSINVCVLSTFMGMMLDFSEKRLYELSLGALLHDVGKTQVPLSILNKPASLSRDEFEIVQAHTEIGFELLRRTQSFSVVPMHAAFQHHEKYDGSGYPRHLAGEEIHEYARIIAIADVYDALTSDRPYKRACTPDVAREIMIFQSPGHFDPALVELFFEHVAPYPIGTVLKLTNKYYVIVIDVPKGHGLRPKVRLLADPDKNLIENPALIDLATEPTYQILSVVKETELVELMLYSRYRQPSS